MAEAAIAARPNNLTESVLEGMVAPIRFGGEVIRQTGGALKTIGKTFSYLGRMASFALRKTAFAAVLATPLPFPGYGLYAWATDKWPFIEIPEREHILTNTFYGTYGPVITGPGTRFFVTPFIKPVIRNGKPFTLSAEVEKRPKCEGDFSTMDGLEGTFDFRYNYIIPHRGAKKFLAKWGADLNQLDQEVLSALRGRIGSTHSDIFVGGKSLPDAIISKIVNARATARRHDVEEKVYKRQEKEFRKELEKSRNYLEETMENLNDFMFNKYGVRIMDLQIEKITFDKESEQTRSAEERGIQEAAAIRHKATAGEYAIQKTADGNLYSTTRKALATVGTIETYLEAARKLVGGKRPSNKDVKEAAMFLIDRDADQEVGETGGTIVKMVGAPYSSQQPQNLMYVPVPQKKAA